MNGGHSQGGGALVRPPLPKRNPWQGTNYAVQILLAHAPVWAQGKMHRPWALFARLQ